MVFGIKVHKLGIYIAVQVGGIPLNEEELKDLWSRYAFLPDLWLAIASRLEALVSSFLIALFFVNAEY